MLKNVTWKKIIWLLCGYCVSVVVAVGVADEAWSYFGILSLPFFAYICMSRPFLFPLGAYAFLIPFDSILSVTGSAQGTTATKLLGILSIMTLLLKGSFENKLKQPDLAAIWWVFFVMYAFLTFFWAIDPSLITGRLLSAGGLLVLYLVTVAYRVQRNEYDTLKYCILAGGLAAALMTIYNYVTGNVFTDISVRASVMIGDRETGPNKLAFDLLMPFSIGVLLMQTQKGGLKKGLYVVMLTLLLFGIVLTGSRGGLLGACAIVCVFIAMVSKKVGFAGLLISIAVVVLFFLPELYIDRVTSSVETNGSGRTVIWKTGLEALAEHWMIGSGLDNFPRAFRDYVRYDVFREVGDDRAPHNILLGNFVEFGILGMSLTVGGFIRHYQRLRTLPAGMHSSAQADWISGEQIMLKAAFFGVLVASMFLDTFWYKSFWLLWTMILLNKHLATQERWT